MTCKNCNSTKIANVIAKCDDRCYFRCGDLNIEINDYVPEDFEIGGGDYIKFSYCLNCGRIQGNFPLQN